ncbi:hypothetical protein [Paenibacillus glucanolyticus]|uniref:hypothetical protein n=1 Tax=Paenibacillus glucanolyticus TaxID=59843 RepID=UPI00096F6B4C|nr:hypothetical protein [Paenibacillus glucanolyticus]OMF70483.1 hypothetical protein BK142_23700 [Paenibacillus glucanolyticus]
MYYLRKEPHEVVIPAIDKTDGTVIPERKYTSEDRAIYKHSRLSRWYRGRFTGISGKYQGMRVYQCKTVKRILEIRKSTYKATGEYFDVYDENGKVAL